MTEFGPHSAVAADEIVSESGVGDVAAGESGVGDVAAGESGVVDTTSEPGSSSADAAGPAATPATPDEPDELDELDELANLEQRPLAEHAEVYEQLHRRLQSSLAEIDSA